MPMRYLRQLKTGRIYIYTPHLAKRSDMVEETLESAEARIAAMKESKQATDVSLEEIARRKEEAAKLTSNAAEIARLEKEAEESRSAQVKKAEAEILGEQKLNPDDVVKSKDSAAMKALEEEDRKSKILTQDEEYNKVLEMKEKKEVLDYLAISYGIKEDPKKSFQLLKNVALAKRSERVFER